MMIRNSYKKMRNIIAGIIVIALLLCLVFYAGTRYAKQGSQDDTITSTAVLQSLNEISELATAEYQYTKVGKFKNSLKLNGWTIPLTEKSFILTYNGIIKAGYDLDGAKVNIKDKKIMITMPKVKVLSHTIDEKSIELYDETNNVFNAISVSDYTKFAVQQKKTALSEAVKNGLYKKAQSHAETAITSYFGYLDGYNVNLDFEK